MSIWDAHYDALYAQLGTSAELTPSGPGDTITVTVIPKIGGVSVSAPNADDLELQTIQPAADVRMTELIAKGIDDLIVLHRGQIEVAGKTWRIETWRMKPSPEGEANGEVRLMLSEAG